MFLSIVEKPDAPEYCYHQYLWAYFNEEKTAERQFVYRIFNNALLLLSRHPPSCPNVFLNDKIESGRAYQFDLLCSPIRGTYRDDSGKRHRRGSYQTHIERQQWLARRFEDSADIKFSQVFNRPLRVIKKADGKLIMLHECTIRGVIYVNDKSNFIDKLLTGIGGRGAWGHGLMVLPEIMQCKP